MRRTKTKFEINAMPLEEEEQKMVEEIKYETMIEQLNENIDQMNIP